MDSIDIGQLSCKVLYTILHVHNIVQSDKSLVYLDKRLMCITKYISVNFYGGLIRSTFVNLWT